jgi:lipopolysaccharide export system permease protein
MPKIIQRYIRHEILPPFFLSLWVFTLVLFMENALDLGDLVITRGVKFVNILNLILYTLPSLLWLSIPMGFLMAVLTGLGRLSMDNEIIAMHSLGIGNTSFLKPVLTLGLLLFLLCFVIGSVGVPWGRSSLNLLVYRILQESATAGIEPKAFNDQFADLIIYAENVSPEENALGEIIISDYRSDFPETIIAKMGKIETNPKTLTNTLTLSEGSVHQYEAEMGRYRLIRFEEYALSLSTDSESGNRLVDLSEENPAEMTLSRLKKLSNSKDPVAARTFKIHYQEKFSLPFSCIVFGLFSIPLGIRFKRSGKAIGFSSSLLIVFFYYILLGIGRNFGSQGVIPAQLAPWLPNLTFGFLGVYLFFQTSRKIPKEQSSKLSKIKQKLLRLFASASKNL